MASGMERPATGNTAGTVRLARDPGAGHHFFGVGISHFANNNRRWRRAVRRGDGGMDSRYSS